MYFSALQTASPSESALVDSISAATISKTSKTCANIISTMYMDVSFMSSSPKPTDDDFDIEDEPDIDKGSGDDSNPLLLSSTVTLGGKCMNF